MLLKKHNRDRLYGVDGLRFIAALSVVFFHYFCYSLTNEQVFLFKSNGFSWLIDISKYGFLGVELFFIISGFVIVYSADGKSWKAFAQSRFLRIYPTLWLAAAITYFSLHVLGSTSKEPTLWQFFTNLTLLHRFIFNQEHLDGVYWTLTVELRFYLVIGILLWLNALSESKLKLIMIFWSILSLVYLWLGKNANFITSGAYFTTGVGFYYFWACKQSWSNTLFLMFSWLCCCVAVCLAHDSAELSRVVLVSLISLFYVCFLTIIYHVYIPFPIRILSSLGGLTYPLYLIHQELGYSILQYARADINYVYYACMLIISLCCIAWLIHHYIEPKIKSITAQCFFRASR